jgi:MFS transporter, OFA family, oxalate/formate antiporter
VAADVNLEEAPEAVCRSRAVSRCPFFFGWVILGTATLGVMMTAPGQTFGVSAFLDQIIADLGMSRSTVSLLYSLGTLAGAGAMPFVGRWIDLYGPRAAVTVIAALFALACIGMSRVSGPVTLLLGFLAIRCLGQGALGLVSIHTVNLWFVRRRGLAVGMLGVGMAATNAVLPLFINFLIAEFGWRTAYALLGLLVAGTILPAGYAFFRDRPERFGLRPDGRASADDAAGERAAEEDWTLAEARRSPMFWLLIGGGVLPSALGTGLIFHHFSIMEQNGLDRLAAATVFVPMAGVAAAAHFCSGMLLDRLQPRMIMSAALLLLAIVLVASTRVTSGAGAWLYGGGLGLMQGMQGALAGMVWAYYFGRRHHGAIKGFAFMVLVGGSALGPLPFAWGMEAVGHYGPVLTASALLPLIVAIVALFVPSPKKPEPSEPCRLPK